MLERLLTQAMCHGWKARMCEIQAAMAEALNSQGRRRKVQSVLLDGVALARRTGLAGIERHLRGDDALLKSWMARTASGPDEDCPDVALVQLSRRELAVLQLIALGLANREISERLHISLHTVKSHAQRINVKLGVSRRTLAIVRAKALGLVS